jgi:PAS domain S-box-containing protein
VNVPSTNSNLLQVIADLQAEISSLKRIGDELKESERLLNEAQRIATKQKQDEESRRNSRDTYRSLFENMLDGADNNLRARRAEALLELPMAAEQLDEVAFLQYGLELTENLTDSQISFIHFVNDNEETIELITWSRRTLEQYCHAAFDKHYPVCQAGIWADALRKHQPVTFNDYASYPNKLGLPEGHSELVRLISVPVIENGKAVMLAGVGNKKTDYTDVDVETVQLLSNNIWYIAKNRRTQNKLAQFSCVLEQSLNEIYIFDSETLRFVDVNLGARSNLGYTIEEIQQMTPLDINPEFTAESFAALIAPLRLKEMHQINFMSRHRRKDGSTYPVEVHLETTNDAPPLFVAIIKDVTERNLAEELLRKSSEEIEDLYNNAPCGYHSLDKDGIIIRINNTELAWMGYTREEVIGKMKWTDFLPPKEIQHFRENFPLFVKRGFVNDIECEIIRKDGTVYIALLNATAIYDPSGNFVKTRTSVVDITERKRAEQKLRELTGHIQAVREVEKAAIAREIHDDLGGTLTAMKMETHQLKNELSAKADKKLLLGHIGEMTQLIDNAMFVTRNIITGLRPSILDDLGVLAALEWQAEQFQKRSGIECRVNFISDKDANIAIKLDSTRSIVLFRIAQEALTNVMRHSGASKVEIEFHHGDDEIVMSIIDNGRGMKETGNDDSRHFGILGMRERANQMGGKIILDPSLGGGFNVTVILPLAS